MPDVRLPDGRVARFPDDMPREQIKAVIAEKFPQTAGTPTNMSQTEFDGRFAGTGKTNDLQDRLGAAVQGLSFGFSDELLGMIAGGAALARGKGWDTAGKVRKAFTQDQRNQLSDYRQRKPVESMGYEIGGALPTAFIPMGGLGRAAQGGNLLRSTGAAAAQGGLLGAAYGAGAADGDVGDRLKGAGTGGLIGAGIGTALQPATKIAGNKLGGLYRSIFNPDDAAARRVADALRSDAASRRPGIQPADEAIARQNNQVITNLDRGGYATRNLARAASNISGDAEAAVEGVVRSRFETQGERVTDAIKRLSGGAQTEATRDALKLAAARQNAPAYRQIFAKPEAQNLWDDTLMQLTGDPDVAAAIRMSSITARSNAVKNGYTPIKTPFTQDPQTGRMMLADPNVRPNLQFWDDVKQQLDKVKTPNSMAMARTLRTYLDDIVPGYADVRAGAAKFFGEENALDAGFSLYNSNMTNEALQRAVQKMTPAERKLLGTGYANAMVHDIGNKGFNRDVVIAKAFNSANGRARLEAAMGKQSARELEAVLRIESMMDLARKAMGNSSTVKQWLAVGGATGGYGYGTGDWRPAMAALGAFLVKRGVNAADRRIMTKVAEKLMSQDPKVVQEGMRAAARDARFMEVLRRVMAAPAISQASPSMSQ